MWFTAQNWSENTKVISTFASIMVKSTPQVKRKSNEMNTNKNVNMTKLHYLLVFAQIFQKTRGNELSVSLLTAFPKLGISQEKLHPFILVLLPRNAPGKD